MQPRVLWTDDVVLSISETVGPTRLTTKDCFDNSLHPKAIFFVISTPFLKLPYAKSNGLNSLRERERGLHLQEGLQGNQLLQSGK